jgi:ribosome maturation protein SDO1
MGDTVARLKVGKLDFETMVDLDSAMKMRKGENVDINEVIRDTAIYTDQKKGMHAGRDELENAFGSTDLANVVERIVKKGELEVTQEFRNEALEAKRKQVIDFLTRNAIDVRTGRPYTADILENALKEAGVNIQDKPIDKQINFIMDDLKKIIPIKIETKKIKALIPAQFTGQIYNLINEYKEKENWMDNGDLEVVLNLPVGLQMEFYDKLNSMTHGSVITEEVSE